MYAAFLDVNAAFDVVPHDSLMRHLFHTGVDGKTWSLIHSLHEGAESVVKWQGNLSEPFKMYQGVRQGGILSTDLFKVHGNGLLDRLVKTGRGCYSTLERSAVLRQHVQTTCSYSRIHRKHYSSL